MHPAYSVIFFTVGSGAGLGLLILLGLAPLLGAQPTGAFGWVGFVLAFGLTTGGLISSTFHLGRPERAWRAFSQWRSSWLSREGVLAVATLIVGGLYAAGALLLGLVSPILGLATALLALATVYATAMIYGQLRTVRRWNTPWTAICYLAFALASGALLLALVSALSGAPLRDFALLMTGPLMLLAWGAKLMWWRTGDAAALLSTPETATGLGDLGRVRLLEAPHTSENYLLKEMGFQIARKHRDRLRFLALLAGGLGPILLTIFISSLGAPQVLAAILLILTTTLHLVGMFAERWLFFAEAEHAVTTYYDRRSQG